MKSSQKLAIAVAAALALSACGKKEEAKAPASTAPGISRPRAKPLNRYAAGNSSE